MGRKGCGNSVWQWQIEMCSIRISVTLRHCLSRTTTFRIPNHLLGRLVGQRRGGRVEGRGDGRRGEG